MDKKKTAVIIGAGPAGLTAAYELLTRTDILPIILEADPQYVGGIARTVQYGKNRIDIGGHRFFSKSDRVMDWWLKMMPLSDDLSGNETINYQGQMRNLASLSTAEQANRGDMLLRKRKSRIYYSRHFFDYPVKLNANTLRKLGLMKVIKIGLSYSKSALFPIKNEQNLEQFFINRFGKELYLTFFKSYTEKVWGRACHEISAEWGRQRIKGLSLRAAAYHFVKSLFTSEADIRQKNHETSLIERFLYPKFGPGQLWEIVAEKVKHLGATLEMGAKVNKVFTEENRITAIEYCNAQGETLRIKADYFFSTMPVKDLIAGWQPQAPALVQEVSSNLEYRDFFTVGLLVKELKIKEENPQANKLIQDNWIYIQEPDVEIGRLQVFNNWSPYMVEHPDEQVWLGLEYFCKETDAIWQMTDKQLIALGKEELAKIGIIHESSVLDACVIRMPKTYPGYFGSYERFDVVSGFLMQIENLFPLGRNGMHKYNNQDHSMLTAMITVDQLQTGQINKAAIWEINTEMEYHEEK